MRERFRTKSKAAKIGIILICVPAMIALFSWIVMALWNAILPAAITSVNPISFWQAMGILVLSKILFSGFGGKGRGRRRKWDPGMVEKWRNMSTEEREEFKQSWKARCGDWRGRFSQPREQQPQTGAPGAE